MGKDKAFVLRQILWRPWLTRRRQIGGCRTQNQMIGCKTLADKAAVGKVARTKKDVETFFNQIDIPVCQTQVNRNLGVSPKIFRKHGRQHMASPGHRRADAKPPPRL